MTSVHRKSKSAASLAKPQLGKLAAEKRLHQGPAEEAEEAAAVAPRRCCCCCLPKQTMHSPEGQKACRCDAFKCICITLALSMCLPLYISYTKATSVCRYHV